MRRSSPTRRGSIRTAVRGHSRPQGTWRGKWLGYESKVPYERMTLDEIKALPVANLAADDAHLYLWTTNGFLRAGYEVVEAWGFKPSTLLTWCKSTDGDRARRRLHDHHGVRHLRPSWFAQSRCAAGTRRGSPSSGHTTRTALRLTQRSLRGSSTSLSRFRLVPTWSCSLGVLGSVGTTWGNESLGTAEMIA